jgi:hypothetical protein
MLGGWGAGVACRQCFLVLADDSDDDFGAVAGGLLGLTIVPKPSLASSWGDSGAFPPVCTVSLQAIMLGTSFVTSGLTEVPSLCLCTLTILTGVEGFFGGGSAPLEGCTHVEGSGG